MASIEYIVNATDAASRVFEKIGLSADNLDQQLHDLSDRVATPEVDLKDAKFTAGIIKAAERIDKLSAMVADPKVEVDGRRAQTEILRISAMLDRLDAKRVSVDVGVDRSLMSRIGGLFPGGGAGAGGILGGIGSAGTGVLPFLGSGAGIAGIGGLAALASTLIPSLLPLGLGGVTGLGAGGLALMLGAKGAPLLQADRQALARARASVAASPKTPATASQLLALQQAQAKFAHDQALYGEFQPLNRTFAGLGRTALGTFAGALESTGFGVAGHPGGPSFLTSLGGILKQITGFVKTLQPELGSLFRAAVPYLQTFVHFLEQAAKVLLPVFTQMLQQMQPYLPLMAKGLMNIVQGLAGFLNAIGPSGMQASAKIFVVLTKGMAAVLVALGHTINWLTENVPKWTHDIAAAWDKMFRAVSAGFDMWRHDWAHTWDVVFNNTIGRVQRGGHDIEREWNTWTHNVGVIFDAFRHATAQVWNLIWDNTIGRIRTGVGDAVSWFRRLPGDALAALRGFGHSLYGFAHAALTEFLDGLKSVGGSVLGWLRNFIGGIPHAIMSFLHMSPPHAGSVFYDLGANLMQHFEAGVKSRANSAAGAIRGAVGGPAGGSAAAAAAYGRRLAAAYGWAGQWGAINAVAMRESGWSLTARNPSSGAYGIAQFINGPSEYYQYGGNPNTIAGQVTAFYNYIRQRYGSPSAAWAHEVNFGWYDRGGWLPPGLTLALNQTGRPERVGGGGGNTYQITVNVPPTVNKADVGRAAVEAIVEFEKRSGAGWRR